MRRNSHYRPVGSYPTLSPLPEDIPGGLLSVALVLLQNIVCSTPLFKGAPCSVQSGLSSTGKDVPAAIARDQNVPSINISYLAQYARIFKQIFKR